VSVVVHAFALGDNEWSCDLSNGEPEAPSDVWGALTNSLTPTIAARTLAGSWRAFSRGYSSDPGRHIARWKRSICM
jgi:hypothetical protein